jgi:sigma-B regulation protein RsbQ
MSHEVLQRHHVTVRGQGQTALVFSHGFGCDQKMWRFVAPAFEATHRVVLFDHVGCGQSDLHAFDERRHARIEGYAQDLVDILDAADLQNAVIVGHSVSSMIGALAAIARPQRVAAVVMIGPSPRYLNDPPDYVGGFEQKDIEGLLNMMDQNMLGWASFLSPMVMGQPDASDMTLELKQSFCAMDPLIAKCFAGATFRGDNRADLPRVQVPCQIIQMSHDAVSPPIVGEYVARHLTRSRMDVIEGNGHCAHMTHPQEVIRLMQAFLPSVAH